MLPLFDPVGAALGHLLGGVDAFALDDPDGGAEGRSASRRTRATSTSSRKIARENGWDMFVDHDGPLGGFQAALHFAARPPRAGPHVHVRPLADRLLAAHHECRPDRQRERLRLDLSDQDDFIVTLGWDWDRSRSTIASAPGSFRIGRGDEDDYSDRGSRRR